MEFETGEEVIWKGRPAYHIRYLTLTVLFFGIFVINLGPIGQAIGVISFFLLIILLVASIVSLFLDKGEEILSDEPSCDLAQGFAAGLGFAKRSHGAVGTRAATWGRKRLLRFEGRSMDAFKHVKYPAQIVESGLKLSGTRPSWIGPGAVLSAIIVELGFQPVPSNALLAAPICELDR